MSAARIFKKQSGQFKATVAESQQMLAATKQLVEHVHSERPPAILPASRNRFDSTDKSTRYILVNSPDGSLKAVEAIETEGELSEDELSEDESSDK